MEQLESQLPAAEVALTADILDRIDQLVAPGVTINPDDNSYGEAELTPAARRRTVTVLQTARYVGSLLAGGTRGTDDSPGPCPSADTAGEGNLREQAAARLS